MSELDRAVLTAILGTCAAFVTTKLLDRYWDWLKGKRDAWPMKVRAIEWLSVLGFGAGLLLLLWPSSLMSNRGLHIIAVVPNPVGSDEEFEAVTIRNGGGAPVSLVGWRVRDSKSYTWRLDSLAVIDPGGTKTIQRSGQKMSLNNDGDTVELVDSEGTVVHSVRYGAVKEGEEVTFP